jgi:AsmA family protein
MRILWKILAAAGVLVVAAAFALVVALSTLDASALVGPVRNGVKALTGRELIVDGPASLTLWPVPKLVLEDVALPNAAWAAAPRLLTAKRCEVEVRVLPLLSRRIEMATVEWSDVTLSLEVNREGLKNWSPPAQHVARGEAQGGSPATFGIDSFVVTNGTLSLRDQTGTEKSVAVERLSLRARDLSSPLATEFRGRMLGVEAQVDGTVGTYREFLQGGGPYPISLKGKVAGRSATIAAKLGVSASELTLDALDMKLGASALAGRFSVAFGKPRLNVTFDLAGPSLVAGDLPFALETADTARTPVVASSKAAPRLFADTPFDLAPLRGIDVSGKLALGRLQLDSARQFDDLQLAVRLDGGRLEVTSFRLGVFGGTLAGRLDVDARKAGDEAIALRVDGEGLDFPAILSALGGPRDVRGGKTQLHADLTMNGASPHAWVSSASGLVRVAMGPATLMKGTGGAFDSVPEKVFGAVNPFYASDPHTEIECAALRLQFATGIASGHPSMVMESQKVTVSAGGTLDFRDESMDLTYHSRMHEGLPTGAVPRVSDFVRVRGPFASPQITFDVAGPAKAVARIGSSIGNAGRRIAGSITGEGKPAKPCEIEDSVK